MLLAPVLPVPDADATDTPLTSVRTSLLPCAVTVPDVPDPSPDSPPGSDDAERHARHHARHGRDIPARRDGVDGLLVEHVLSRCVLHVHDRRLAGHGDRFLNGPDPHFGVDGGGERPGQLDAVAPDGVEARQRDRTVYVPGRRFSTRYWPVSSVTADRTFSISAGLALRR